MFQMNDPIFRIDGELIESHLIDKFNLRNFSRNLRFSYKKNSEVVNFVGFVIKDSDILVVLPKRYSNKEILNRSDIELLFAVLLTDQIRNPQKYTGPVKEFDSSFPFHAFYSIYSYFKQYGLYKESEKITISGYSGKISWKDTIKKSANIISEGNLIYLPLYVQETEDKHVFLSNCMAFAISFTLRTFPYFVQGKEPVEKFNHFDFWNNRAYVVNRLKKIHTEVFKDTHKRLVKDLIDFFSNCPEGGSISIKHYNFELVWESMVEEFLNGFFTGVNETGLHFSQKRHVNTPYKFNKAKYNVDKVHSQNRLEPDHYYLNNEVQFIFDAKYYFEVKGLNHKQVAYQTLLKKMATKTHNALILPTDTENRTSIHFDLKEEYYDNEEDRVKIFEYYLNMKGVMENYVK
ncbi:LlaJI family restriction endonuclease [Gracilibacillus oryzae]|uniref:LlaJI family restriction endonuclease n=1 Tax=Gracilibacillus oryzae TaxID=1672701 RepID=A0A7C8L0W3_9BACI|nr:LlaJI family restriction endonuclease [Gracilibacillus oryzae]KAB8126058.1 LlaJI family restriction endonuclease [Gracilibacillus oryzae]